MGKQRPARKYRFRAYAAIALLLLWRGGILPAAAQIPSLPAHRVVVLLVPGLRAEDLTRLPLPGLAALRAEGAAGWMICRAARTTDRGQLAPDGRDTSASLALTLGSGSRMLAAEAIAGTENRKEEKEKRRKGEEEIATQHSLKSNPQSTLGDLIHTRGWRATVYGNADTDTRHSEGLLLARDSRGNVDALHTQAVSDSEAMYVPYGIRDDTDSLQRALSSLAGRDALCILVFGDLARADDYAPLCLPTQAAAHRLAALRSLDRLLTAFHTTMQTASGPPIRFLLLSPAPAISTEVRDRLAPILMWGHDVSTGNLTSPSTRLAGIVVNTDFLPTVAGALGLPPPSNAIGRAFQVQPTVQSSGDGSATLAAWRTAHDRLLLSERLKDVYGGLPTLQALLVLTALGLYQHRQRRFACACCAAIVALPFALLMLPSLLLVPSSIPGAGAMLAAVVIVFAGIAWRLYPSRHGVPLLLTALFAVLLGAITLDLLSGSPLLRQAWMSYSVLEAARFYGIGNEYMGVVIGAACILLGHRQDKETRRQGDKEKGSNRPKTEDDSVMPLPHQSFMKISLSPLLLVSLSSLLLLFLLGYNRFGAKVGAVPSAGIAFGVELLMLWRGRLRWRDIFVVSGVTLLSLGGLLLLDIRHSVGEQSHFARTFTGSGGGIFAAAARKLLLEGYLLLHSPWSAALITASFGFAFIIGKGTDKETRKQGDKERAKHQPSTLNPGVHLRSGKDMGRTQLSTVYGLVAGVLASLLCNDSGVTAAAMIMLFGFAWAMTQAADHERLSQAERLPVTDTVE